MHFTLTAIDREGKEHDIIRASFLEHYIKINFTDKDHPHDRAWIYKDKTKWQNAYIIKELSTPSELEAWRKKWGK